jgi:hypothetical protein
MQQVRQQSCSQALPRRVEATLDTLAVQQRKTARKVDSILDMISNVSEVLTVLQQQQQPVHSEYFI